MSQTPTTAQKVQNWEKVSKESKTRRVMDSMNQQNLNPVKNVSWIQRKKPMIKMLKTWKKTINQPYRKLSQIEILLYTINMEK